MHTLSYDKVVILFRRFQGSLRGTVQYLGGLLKLLDVPSYSVAVKKLLKSFSRAMADQGSIAAIEKVRIVIFGLVIRLLNCLSG